MEGESQNLNFKIETLSTGEKIKARLEQGRADRLVEYLTGLSFNDPKLIDKLESDQKDIRDKYKLPDRVERFQDPNGYERKLRELAEEIGVEIKDTSTRKDFFEKYLIAGALYDDKEKTVIVDIDKTDESSYTKSLGTLEHEMIHALQDKYFPEMDIEHQEYEAYVAAWNMDYLRENDSAVRINFDWAIGGSIGHWYKEEKLEEEWNNPEYFLKNVDRVNDGEIEKYKNNNLVNDIEK